MGKQWVGGQESPPDSKSGCGDELDAWARSKFCFLPSLAACITPTQQAQAAGPTPGSSRSSLLVRINDTQQPLGSWTMLYNFLFQAQLEYRTKLLQYIVQPRSTMTSCKHAKKKEKNPRAPILERRISEPQEQQVC